MRKETRYEKKEYLMVDTGKTPFVYRLHCKII